MTYAQVSLKQEHPPKGSDTCKLKIKTTLVQTDLYLFLFKLSFAALPLHNFKSVLVNELQLTERFTEISLNNKTGNLI